MESQAYGPAGYFLGSLRKGDDLLAGLDGWCRDNRVTCGLIWVIGSLSRAVLGFYDQQERVYRSFRLDEPLEIVSGSGNVSLKDGRPFCHVHLVVADSRGRCFGGHLMPDCSVFAAEVHLAILDGAAPVRLADKNTGLSLWDLRAPGPTDGGA